MQLRSRTSDAVGITCVANFNPKDWRQYVSKAPAAVRTVPAERPDKKNPDVNNQNWHSENTESPRIADAITAVNRTLADQGSANRREERREDTGNKWLQGLTLAFVIATTIGIFSGQLPFSTTSLTK